MPIVRTIWPSDTNFLLVEFADAARAYVAAKRSGLLLRDFSKPVLIANLVAWPLAYFAAQQYLSVFIQRIALTPIPFLLSLAITILIACAAVGGQALRAARVSPAHVLRFE